MNFSYFLRNPVIIALIAGFLSGNYYTALTVAAFVLLYEGITTKGATIAFFTTLLVNMTNNINFEIIFIFVLTVFYLVAKMIKKRDIIISSLIVLFSIPIWNIFFVYIPAQILNDFNVAGELLLLTAIIYKVYKGQRAVLDKSAKALYLIYLRILLAVVALLSVEFFLYFAPIFIIADYYFSNHFKSDGLTEAEQKIYFYLFFILAFISINLLLPFELIIYIMAIFIYLFLIYIKDIAYIDLLYLSLILGLNFSQLTFLA